MFRNENELVKTITKSITERPHKFLVKKNYPIKILKEINLGYGVPDIIIAQHNSQRSNGKKILGYFDLSILKLIENIKEIKIQEIINATRASRSTITKSVNKLIESGYVAANNDKYFIVNNYKSVLVNSIAIEAKLYNWQRALNQAYRYNWFSNKSFVILPSDKIFSAKVNISRFKKLNVGLASINKKGELIVSYNPPKLEPISQKMSNLLNEEVLKSLFKKSQPC